MKIKALLIAAIVATVTTAQATTYHFIAPSQGPKEYLNAVQSELRRFVENAPEATEIKLLNTEGKILCSLKIQNKSVGNWPRLLKTPDCSKLKMILQLGNRAGNEVPAIIPRAVSALLQNVVLKEGDHVVLFDSPIYKDNREMLDFSKGYPSQGHTTPLAYGLSSFSTHNLPKAPNSYLHVIYPVSVSFINKQHEVQLNDFYRIYADQLGMKLASYQPVSAGIAKMYDSALLKNLPQAKPDASMGSVFFVDLTKAATAQPVKKTNKPYWEDLLTTNKTVVVAGETLARYQFDLSSPASIRTISMIEADGDYDGSNYLRIDLIHTDGSVTTLPNLIPSANNVVKTHILDIKSVKPTRSLIILPIKDGQRDELGGEWLISKLAVQHR